MRRLFGSTAIAAILAGAAGIGAAQAQLQPCGQGAVDANADGTIDADEEQAYRIGVYSGTDFNGDGLVSRNEYCFDPSQIEPAAGPVVEVPSEMPSIGVGAEALAAHFHSFDGDGDGEISREEWTGVDSNENAGAGAQGGYFDSMDANLDHQLTLEEFFAARGVAYDPTLL